MSVTTGGYEPPETAVGALDEELTVPEEADRLPEDVLDEEVDEVELEVLELDALWLGVLEPVDVDAVDVLLVVPGMVWALTVPKMPTPATAAKAMPAVMWLRRERARSRARILASADLSCPIVIRLRPPSQSSL
ncbi:MAG TPA: hypothetical protein VLR46_01615 [Candidatus Dormibacteraeota bacterium]|nr:hypothetical protein [Candidatus Dormibacteraeota bacterium]